MDKLRQAFVNMTNDGKCITARPYRDWNFLDVGMVDVSSHTFLPGEIVLTFADFIALNCHLDYAGYLEKYHDPGRGSILK